MDVLPRRYHFESSFPTYHELRFKPYDDKTPNIHQIYWHFGIDSQYPCSQCNMIWTVEPTLMNIVQKINPGDFKTNNKDLMGAVVFCRITSFAFIAFSQHNFSQKYSIFKFHKFQK